MISNRTILTALMVAVVGLAQLAVAQVPEMMNYQGFVTDATSGDPLDGTYSFTFRIFGQAIGGAPLWIESHNTVDVTDGLFNVILGQGTPPVPVTADRFGGPDRWLEIEVDGQVISPRTRLTSVPYAFRIGTVDGATGGTIAGDVTIQDVFFFDENASAPLPSAVIGFDYPDTDYDRRLRITAGKEDNHNNDQGASIDLHGNQCIVEEWPKFGDLDLVAGRNGAVNFFSSMGSQDARLRMVLDKFGNLGIGTAMPWVPLDVRRENPGGNQVAGLFSNPSDALGTEVSIDLSVGTGAPTAWRLRGTGAVLQLGNAVGVPVSIDGLGRIGIGVTTPSVPLHVRGENAGGNQVAGLFSNPSDAPGTEVSIDLALGTMYPTAWRLRGTGAILQLGNAVGVPAISIDGVGRVGIGMANPANILTVQQGSATDPIADAWTEYSSRRWKENIVPIPNALEKVKRLTGVYFDWKDTKHHDMGMIAEEVGEVVPEVVSYEENGKDAKGIDYARLTSLLVEAVKEQQKTIDELKAQLSGLQDSKTVEIESLKAQMAQMQALVETILAQQNESTGGSAELAINK